MHKTAKRSAQAVAAGVFALALAVTGCSSNNTNSNTANGGAASPAANGDDNSPATFSVFMSGPGQQPTADNKILKLIKEKTGVSFNMEFLVGDLKQKLGVMIAGGDYPDIMSGDDKLINAKAYIPLEDLIEKHAPNLKNIMLQSGIRSRMRPTATSMFCRAMAYIKVKSQNRLTRDQASGFRRPYLRKWDIRHRRLWMSISISLLNIKKNTRI